MKGADALFSASAGVMGVLRGDGGGFWQDVEFKSNNGTPLACASMLIVHARADPFHSDARMSFGFY